MDQNSSSKDLVLVGSDHYLVMVRTTIVQVFVWFFIYVDMLMLFTFFSKQAFRSDARYILFAHTLLGDSVLLLLTDLVVLLGYFRVLMPVSHCVVLCILMGIVVKNTPYTITAMCLERYVAICMPLRHASISTTGRTMVAIAVVWAFSSVKVMMDLAILVVTAPPGYFAKPTSCYYQVMLVTEWHNLMHIILNEMGFGIIMVIILFCYTKIMLAAQAASGENKQSVSKGRRTLLFHGLQLILCMADLWTPYILAAVQKQSPHLYLTIRFFIFIAFTIISRALSPLIYGLRDKKFFLALKYYMSCKVYRSLEKRSSLE
ncbi:odorant receptor 131-2-like [Anguilla anguilla]|uniref:odorant receptor 131-2-like n=1 Tax=Anguilla anguilla TaxID=7936 RepID=UPI0015ADD285|nr:odorant receptor 131-2-like [Anguilla anguilla]